MLEARGISKWFGPLRANHDVSFRVDRGEIVGLVGENGAGKSTLLSILAGFREQDAGSLVVEARERRFRSPADALRAGIGLVHQHLSLVPTLTVREQLRLAGWDGGSLPSLLHGVDGDALVEHLSLGERQRLEIARVLVTGPRLLLLDEPTSILAPSEVGGLFAILREIRANGTSVVIVTHKLREVLAIADRMIVMARGEVVATFARDHESWPPGIERLVLASMFGEGLERQPGERAATVAVPDRERVPVMVAKGITGPAAPGRHALRGIDLTLTHGDVHAVTGVDGQGQVELAEALAGYIACDGDVALDGQRLAGTDAETRARAGIGLMSGDRLGEAGIGEFSVLENLILKRPRPAALGRGGVFHHAAALEYARRAIAAWGVRPADPAARFATLSGGNMQRVIAAREFDRASRVLIALNPVQGLDARTAELMWTRLHALAGAGCSVLAFVNDLDEALDHADRVAVIYDGTLTPMVQVSETTRAEIASRMVGG